jgi:hypothetical protein
MSFRSRKRTVWIVQQGVWDMPKESMPLAAGYLKATALQSPVISSEMEVRIFNFGGGDPVTVMAETMFAEGVPDVLAFSVLGWSYYSFGHITECYKQVRPDGWVIWGGTHVAHQGHRTFRQFPDVDVIVNGEGEFIFRDLLLSYLRGTPVSELHTVGGISFRDPEGQVVTTKEPERIMDLDTIRRARRLPLRRRPDGDQPGLPVPVRVLLLGRRRRAEGTRVQPRPAPRGTRDLRLS